MDGRLRISRAIKVLSKYNHEQRGLISLRALIGTYITSSETSITAILSTLGGLGVLTEISPFQFMINTDINIDNNMKELLDSKDDEVLKI